MPDVYVNRERRLVFHMKGGVSPAEAFGLTAAWFDGMSEKPILEQAHNGYMQTAGCPFTPSAGYTLKGRDRIGHSTLLFGDREAEDADPPLKEIGRVVLPSGEQAIIFEYEFMALVDKNGDVHVDRVD